MNEKKDIRWVQRFNSYKKALAKLTLATEEATERDLSDLEKEGLIKRFEYTQELAWLTIKDFYESQGESNIQGSKDAFQLAIKRSLIHSGNAFMETIESRIKTVHTYDEEEANKIYHQIIDQYHSAFLELETALLKEKEERNL